MRTGPAAPPGAVRGAEDGRSRSRPAQVSPRLQGPESPRCLWGTVRHGESTHSRPPRGLPRSLAYRQPCYSLTGYFHAQRTTSQVISSGSLYIPLFKAQRARSVRAARVWLVVHNHFQGREQVLAQTRAKAGEGRRLRQFSSSTPSLGRWRRKHCPGTERGENPTGAAGKAAQPRAVHRAGAGGRRQPHASRQGARLFVLPQRALMRARGPGL